MPQGQLSERRGTTCTDRKTGEWVKPIRKHTIFPKQYPCLEMWKLKKSGDGCKKDKHAYRMIRRHS